MYLKKIFGLDSLIFKKRIAVLFSNTFEMFEEWNFYDYTKLENEICNNSGSLKALPATIYDRD